MTSPPPVPTGSLPALVRSHLTEAVRADEREVCAQRVLAHAATLTDARDRLVAAAMADVIREGR